MRGPAVWLLASGLSGPVLALLFALLALPALSSSAPAAPALSPSSLAWLAGTVGAAFLVLPHFGLSVLRGLRGPARRVTLLALAGAAVAACAAFALGDASDDVALEVLFTLAACLLPMHGALQTARVVRIVLGPLPSTTSARLARLAARAAPLLAAGAGVVVVLTGPRAALLVRGFLDEPLGLSIALALAAAAVAAGVVGAPASGGARAWRKRAFAGLAYLSTAAFALPALLAWHAFDPLPLASTSATLAVAESASAALPHAAQAAAATATAAAGVAAWVQPWSSSSAFAIAHALQLLWLALVVAEPRIAAQRRRTFDPLAWYGLALVVGAFVLVDVPWLASRALAVDLATALLCTQAAFAVAHAVIDAFAWRLSPAHDAELARAVLEDTITPAPTGRADVSNVRAALAMLLGGVVVVGVAADALQSWSVRDGAGEQDLARADFLHPHDSRAGILRAREAIAIGDVDGARAELGNIAIARAFSPAAARERFLLCVADDERARSCLDRVPASLSTDPEVLALAARLALALGEPERAKALAALAHKRAPASTSALAALGLAEARLGDDAALAHLEEALARADAQLAAAAGARVAGDTVQALPTKGAVLKQGARVWLDVGLALAEEKQRRARRELQQPSLTQPPAPPGPDNIRLMAPAQAALDVVDKVLEGARLGDEPWHATRALGVRAHVLEDAGDLPRALDAYQRALRTAPFATQAEPAAGVDETLLWLDYGALLEKSLAEPAARYLCIVKATAALERAPAEHPERRRLELVTSTIRAQLEEHLDAGVVSRVRADVDGETERALSLRYDLAASGADDP